MLLKSSDVTRSVSDVKNCMKLGVDSAVVFPLVDELGSTPIFIFKLMVKSDFLQFNVRDPRPPLPKLLLYFFIFSEKQILFSVA